MLINDYIQQIDNLICKNIENSNIDRGFSSENILASLRNFIEAIALKIYSDEKKIYLNPMKYENITNAIKHIKSIGKLKFLRQFYDYLQISVSHYNVGEENSERLMLKYYEFLIKIKIFLKQNYNINVLYNLNKFPIKKEKSSTEYYKKISEKILQSKLNNLNLKFDKRFYVKKIKPFFVSNKIFYEVTFIDAKSRKNKSDGIIAFTDFDILKNYSVKFAFFDSSIEIVGKVMPILIITKWEVSIKPWEIKNFASILGEKINISTNNNKEYWKLMQFLTKTGFDLLDIISLENDYYKKYKDEILKDIKQEEIKIFNILEYCRIFIKKNNKGSNIIRYLLYRLDNEIINKQKSQTNCWKLSDLFLKWGCIPFDEMPFFFSLIEHNPSISDLIKLIEIKDKKHELLARYIKNNTEQQGKIYTPINELSGFSEINNLIKTYNNNLYSGHKNFTIENFNNNLYIKEYENKTYNIIKELKSYSLEGIKDYSQSVISWLETNTLLNIDSNEKKEILKNMFKNSKVAFIYGAAGTGKSTLINYVSIFFSSSKKIIYLANTNSAIENLKRKVVNSSSDSKFMTIFKFLNNKNTDIECDLLIIDECSCISNKDMYNILMKAKFKLLILVGDIYQIEAIHFGNWFNISKEIIDKNSIFELTTAYRTKNKELLDFWNRVRNYDESIVEYMIKNNYSKTLDESILVQENEDEIILCLNYDGLYGINNINLFLQENNPNLAIKIGIKTYKINDPILFTDSPRFSPLIYNNLKGKILNIEIVGEKFYFDIEIDKVINGFDILLYDDLSLIGTSPDGKSIIRFFVNKYKNDDDEDNEIDNLVPFQVSYALSVHKAQGLEYNSVKIVITDEIDEQITHNIFYTAITRTKEKLKIYWSPETQNKIINNFSKKNNKDTWIFLNKYKIILNKDSTIKENE